jgi:methylenetetrahydrofolate dehydrogenase (NADP+)/methenyltetrahydrofolate cyclohydrolase
MTAHILDGKALADEIRKKTAAEILQAKANGLRPPALAVILVGEDPASEVYVAHKRRDCEQVGIHSLAYDLAKETSQADLLTLIEQLNEDESVDGILVQSPLPPHIDANKIYDSINPLKDVDCFHPYNVGCLAQRRPTLRPCTPYGIITLLAHSGVEIKGRHAVVIGASNIVGKPMALEFLLAKSTVTVCHRFTPDLSYHIKQADILVVAIGNPGVIKSDWIKPSAVVVDVGINRQANGKIIGDIDFETAKEKASWITPVPGGVGPMTRAILLTNTLQAYQKAVGIV